MHEKLQTAKLQKSKTFLEFDFCCGKTFWREFGKSDGTWEKMRTTDPYPFYQGLHVGDPFPGWVNE